MVTVSPLSIPSRPGTYVLILSAVARQSIDVGRLGRLAVHPGRYVYVGSAFGPGGLRARIGRHLRASGSRHWHIDHLKAVTEPVEVWLSQATTRLEHEWARLLGGLPGSSVPLARFGASDCTCESHLFFFQAGPVFDVFRSRVRQANARRVPLSGSSQRQTP